MIKKTLLIIGFSLILPLQGVLAVGSPDHSPASCTDGDWTYCNKLYSADSDFASDSIEYPNPPNPWLTVSNFGSFQLPANATITEISVEIAGYTSNSSSGRQFWIELSKDNGATWQYNSVGNDLMWLNPPTSSTTHTYTTNSNNSYFNSYGWEWDDFNSNNFMVKLGGYDNELTTFYADYLRVHIHYDIPNTFMHVSSSEASASGQFVSMDLNGQTSTSSSTMQCTLSLIERCTKSGFAGWLSPTAVAHIILDATYTQQSTIDLGGGYYKAYNWGGTDYTWVADNVLVPYNSGWSCDYPFSIICSDNHELAYMEDYSDNPELVATPSAGISDTIFVEPEPTNPLAWVIWKIRQTAIELFVPHDAIVLQWSDYFNGLISSKAPLAYGYAVLALDFSNSTLATTAPTIHIDLSHNESGIIPDINWTAPDFFNSAISTIRTAMGVVLWMSFILYLIVRVRSVFV